MLKNFRGKTTVTKKSTNENECRGGDLFKKISRLDSLSERVDGHENEEVSQDEKSYRRKYPLHVAVRFELVVIIKYLVSYCFHDVNVKDNHGKTPLHIAIMNGCVEAVKLLFPLTNVTLDSKTSWLHLAVMSNNVEIVEYILSVTEVNVNLQDSEGTSPLHIAVENNQDVIIEMLLGRSNELYLKNKKRNTVFDLVTSELVELLLVGEEVKQQCGKAMRDIMERVTKSGLCLGEGGFGKVYRIDSLPSGKKVAVKQAHTMMTENAVAKQEIENLYNVKHKNCVRIFHEFLLDGFLNFFMEFVEGSNLRYFINKRLLTPRVIKFITNQLVECLCYLKSIKMIHRDIKPENIMIRSSDDCVKLVDFGIAKIVDDVGSNTKTDIGTEAYMAPEIGSSNYNCKVDVWSLGIVFTEMWLTEIDKITNHRMIDEKYINNLYQKLSTNNRVTDEIKEFFKATVVKDPNGRKEPEHLPKWNVSEKNMW